jgi:hypothetical protein
MLHGIHLALLALSALTLVSTLVFRTLRSNDGDAISLHKPELPAG